MRSASVSHCWAVMRKTAVVSCYLWFPDVGGPFDAVHVTALDLEEWAGLASWACLQSVELPALATFLSGPLPLRMSPSDIQLLAAECDRVDWETFCGSALSGFASLSLVITQAAGQTGAGLRFGVDA